MLSTLNHKSCGSNKAAVSGGGTPSSAALMLHLSSNLADSAGNPITVVGAAAISGAQHLFGAGSLSITAGSALTFPEILLPGDFTVEVRWYPTDTNYGLTFSGGTGPQLGAYAGGNMLYYNAGPIVTGTYISPGSWHALSWVRQSGLVTQFLDGVNAGSVADAGPLSIGTLGGYSGGSGYNSLGYLCEARVTKDRALYTANYTPATAPFVG